MIARTLFAASVAVSMTTTTRAEASGVYATLAAPRAEDCAQACDDDSICMAWRYDATECALRATVPETPLGELAGLSGRALAAGFSMASKKTVGESGPGDTPPAEFAHDLPLEAPPASAAGDALLGGPEPIDLELRDNNLK